MDTRDRAGKVREGRTTGATPSSNPFGNAAVVGGVITSDNTGAIGVGTPFQLFVNDEAKPGDGFDDFLFTISGAPGTPPVCGTPFQFEINIRDGDIVIDRA
jgi:hypothetical protein